MKLNNLYNDDIKLLKDIHIYKHAKEPNIDFTSEAKYIG